MSAALAREVCNSGRPARSTARASSGGGRSARGIAKGALTISLSPRAPLAHRAARKQKPLPGSQAIFPAHPKEVAARLETAAKAAKNDRIYAKKRGMDTRKQGAPDPQKTEATDGSAINALVEETSAAPETVKTLYEEEMAFLKSEAKVTTFIDVIAKQRVKRRLKRHRH